MGNLERNCGMLNLFDKKMWEYVLKDILVEMEILPVAILGGILICFFVGAILHKKMRRKYGLAMTLFFIYFFALINITLMEREAGSRTGISFKLFETMGNSRSNAYVVENALLFMPFGFLTASIWRPMRNVVISLITGALCSLIIEVIQMVTERGHFQVDDIMMNCIGAGVGCLCYLLVHIVKQLIRSRRFM